MSVELVNATGSAANTAPPPASPPTAVPPARFAVIQHGDYRAASALIHSGQAEPYFGMKHSIESLEALTGDAPHLIVSLDSGEYSEVHEDGRWVGLPAPHRPRLIPRTLVTLAWRSKLLDALREFRPTHLLLRSGNPVLTCPILEYCARENVSVLVLMANVVERWRGAHNRYFFNRHIELLNSPNVYRVGNHKAVAARSLVDAGVDAAKVIAWDYPGARNPRAYGVKQLAERGPWTIVYAGSMLYAKGLADLIRAVWLLRQENLAIKLVAFGDGPNIEELRMLAGSLCPRDVLFLGSLPNDDVFEAMRGAAAVCVPSRHEFPEAMPLVLTEALASRTPVAVSDHPVMKSALANGEGVLFFESRNPANLAYVLRKILSDAELYEHLSQTTAAAFARLECRTYFGDVLRDWKLQTASTRSAA